MGAVWRAASRKWPLSRAANCSGSFVARGLNRLAAKSLIWPHILVKLTGAERPRGRYGTNACICKDAPADMVLALGSHYQRLYVIPSLKVVVVRQGSEAKFSDAHFLRLLLGHL